MAKDERPHHQALANTWSNWNSHALLLKFKNGTTALENHYTISQKGKTYTYHRSRQVIPERKESKCLYADLYVNVLGALFVII